MTLRSMIAQSYLLILAFCLTVLGLFGVTDFLLRPEPTLYSVLLLPDSSLMVLFCGLMLCGTCLQRPWLWQGSALLALLLCLQLLLHNLLAGGPEQGTSLLTGFSRPRSLAAVLIGLSVVGLLLAGYAPTRVLSRWLGAVIVLAGLLMGGIDMLTEQGVSIGVKTSAGMLAALIMVLLGGAVLAQSFLPLPALPSPQRSSWLIAIFTALVAVSSWYAIARYEQSVLQRGSDATLDQVENALQQVLNDRLFLLQRMGERWEVNGFLPDDVVWQQEAGSYLRDYKNLRFIALLNPQQRIIRLQQRSPADALLAQELLGQALSTHRHSTGDVSDGHPRVLPEAQAGASSLLAMPLEGISGPLHFLVAGLDLHSSLNDIPGIDAYRFRLRVWRNNQLVYGPADAEPQGLMLIGQRQVYFEHGERWQLETLVNRFAATSDSRYLETWMLGLILLFGFLLLVSQRLGKIARRHNQELLTATAELQRSLKQQQALKQINQLMLRNSPDLICSIDASGRFVQVSDASLTLLGYPAAQLAGHHYSEYLLEEDKARTHAMVQLLVQGQSTNNFRNRYRHKDGHIVDLMWSAVWSEDEQQSFCVARDISELMAQDTLLHHQQQVLRMISQSEPLHDILEAVCRLIEARLPEHLASVMMLNADGQTLGSLAASSLPAAYNQAVDGLAIGENQGSCGTAAFRAQTVLVEDIAHSPLWADYRDLALAHQLRACWTLPMLSRQGDVLGTFALYARVTGLPDESQLALMETCCQLAALAVERQRDRQQLSESEQRYRSLYRYNPDPVFSIGPDGRFTGMNRAGLALTGLTEQQVIGWHFNQGMHSDDQPMVQAHFDAALQGKAQRFEARAWTVAGEKLEFDVSILPIWVNNQVTGVFGIAKDQRAYKQARRDLERSLDEVVRAERELQAQLQFTSVVTDSLQEALLAIAGDGSLRFCNPAAEHLLDVSCHGTEPLPVGNLLPVLLQTGQTAEFEFEREVMGKPRLLSGHASPLVGSYPDNGPGTESPADPETKGGQTTDGWVITLRDITNEREANKALLERNQFFSLSLDMFCMISLQGYFVQTNPAFVQVLGFSADELIGTPYIDIIRTADRAKAEEAINRLVQGEVVEGLILQVRHAQGGSLWLEVSAALGSDRIIYVVARDVSRQKEYEATLARHRMLFEIAGDIARVGGWLMDLKAGEIILSDEVCAMHDIAPGSSMNLEQIYDLYAPEYHTELRDALSGCIRKAEPYEQKVQALSTGGQHLWVRIKARPVLGENGRVTHVQGVVQDISAEVQTAARLQELADRMQNILESITDAFFALDTDWNFTYLNPQAEALLQVRAADVRGKNVWSLFPEAVDNIIYQHYQQAVSKRETHHFESYYPPLDKWLDISAYPSENGLSVYFRDAGERKQYEQKLQKMLTELERSNKDLQDFAFIASHDLQEPLRKIQAFGERLARRSDVLDADALDYLQRMRQAAGRMQNLIQDLLAYSRVTSRGEPLQPVALDNVAGAVLQDLETLLESSGATIDLQPLPTVEGDARQLGQVLQNLLTNAIKFQPAGQTAHIRLYAEQADNHWTICVADNGIGFDEKYLDRIFTPFQRLHDRSQYSGSGIGLAIVKKIIERHGATITASSVPGQGTTFRMVFPPLPEGLLPATARTTGSGTADVTDNQTPDGNNRPL